MKRKTIMHGFKKLYLPLLIAALVVGCGDKKDEAATGEKAPTQVAARVNGTELTVHQVNYALQRIPNLDKEQTKAASLQVVRNLVDQEVISQKGAAEQARRDPRAGGRIKKRESFSRLAEGENPADESGAGREAGRTAAA